MFRSQVVTNQTTKMLFETMVKIHGSFGTILSISDSMLSIKAHAVGSALFQKINSFGTSYASTSTSNASTIDQGKSSRLKTCK